MSARHPCTVEVVEYFLARRDDGTPVTRGRWRQHGPPQELTAEEAAALAKQLKASHGAARVSCEAFEAVAMRAYFGIKLVEPAA